MRGAPRARPRWRGAGTQDDVTPAPLPVATRGAEGLLLRPHPRHQRKARACCLGVVQWPLGLRPCVSQRRVELGVSQGCVLWVCALG